MRGDAAQVETSRIEHQRLLDAMLRLEQQARPGTQSTRLCVKAYGGDAIADGAQVASEAGQSAMLGKDVEQLQRRNRELVEAVSLAESRVRHCCRR